MSALPTKEENSIQTANGKLIVKFTAPDFTWGETNTELPKLTKGDQEVISNPTQKGLQLLWKLKSGNGVEALKLNTELPDKAKWELNPNGSLSLVTNSPNNTKETLMVSEKPWAIDANGKRLPTHYQLLDGKILQRVDTTGALFPIIAGPNWSWWGSLALCIAEVGSIFAPGTQIIKAVKASKAAAFLLKSPKIKKAVNSLGGLNKSMSILLGKLRGKKYSATTERALKKLLDEGKGKVFDILGIGGCYGVYANW